MLMAIKPLSDTKVSEGFHLTEAQDDDCSHPFSWVSTYLNSELGSGWKRCNLETNFVIILCDVFFS